MRYTDEDLQMPPKGKKLSEPAKSPPWNDGSRWVRPIRAKRAAGQRRVRWTDGKITGRGNRSSEPPVAQP